MCECVTLSLDFTKTDTKKMGTKTKNNTAIYLCICIFFNGFILIGQLRDDMKRDGREAT